MNNSHYFYNCLFLFYVIPWGCTWDESICVKMTSGALGITCDACGACDACDACDVCDTCGGCDACDASDVCDQFDNCHGNSNFGSNTEAWIKIFQGLMVSIVNCFSFISFSAFLSQPESNVDDKTMNTTTTTMSTTTATTIPTTTVATKTTIATTTTTKTSCLALHR